jgi:drug/metabolite transporter (DMT)-like permease
MWKALWYQKTPNLITLWISVSVAILSISSASILIRVAHAPVLAIAAYRVAVASVILAPFSIYKKSQGNSPWTQGILLGSLISGLFLSLHFILWIHSLEKTTVASSVTLVSTTPLFTALFSHLWLKEPSSRRLWSGIAFVVIGSGFVAGSDFGFSNDALLGDLLALSGAVMASGYLLVGRRVRQSLNTTAYACIVYGAATFFLITACLITATQLWGFTHQTHLALLLLGLVPQLIGHTIFNWVLRFLSATLVAVLILGEPIGATLLAYVFLEETITLSKGIGLSMLGIGIVLSSLSMPSSE